MINGVAQKPIEGTSLVYAFDKKSTIKSNYMTAP